MKGHLKRLLKRLLQAQKMEAAGKLRDAEKLYLQVQEVDLAISMHKKHKRFDDMIRLVSAHRQELLKETHMFLAQQLELDTQYQEAEAHYYAAGEWLAAVNMYRSLEMWEDSVRVAKVHGGPGAQKRVAYAWGLSIGGEKGAKVLQKQGLIEGAIEYATDSRDFVHAFELARWGCPQKVPEVHLKHAMFMEDEERFAEAEAEFILAGKPREAIDMLTHQKDWHGALRVAQAHDVGAVSDVLCAQAEDTLQLAAASAAGDAVNSSSSSSSAVQQQQQGRLQAEALFLQANKPERALAMYEAASLWAEAVRICQRYLPHKLSEVQSKQGAHAAARGQGGTKAEYLSEARGCEASSNWNGAVDAYLQVCLYECACMCVQMLLNTHARQQWIFKLLPMLLARTATFIVSRS